MVESTRQVLGYRPAFDGLRGLAVLAVFGLHAGAWHLRGGGIGVNLFFALSGFLITTLLLEELAGSGRLALRKFYARRALRLLPALCLVLGAVSVHVVLVRGGREDIFGIGAALFYVANWVRAFTNHSLGLLVHTWSLSVEEQFYLFWPVIVAVVVRRWDQRGLALTALIGAALSLLLRAVLWHGPSSFARVYNGSDTMADQLLWGCALAVVFKIDPRRAVQFLRLAFYPALGYLAFVLFYGLPWSWFVLGYAGIGLASAAVVGHLAIGRGVLARLAAWRPLAWTGRISYGMYLWHYPVLILMPRSVPMWTAAALALTVALAAASYYAVERPLQQRFRSRFVASSPAPAADSDADAAVALPLNIRAGVTRPTRFPAASPVRRG